jgi:predicted dehydrogenase
MPDPQPLRIGVLGCGKISKQYFDNAKNLPILDIVAVADLNRQTAEKVAAERGGLRVLTPNELATDADLDVILNLTIPQAHVPTMVQALEHGKHTFCEKPLGVDRDEAKRVLAVAKDKNLLVGVAPDTVLGSGIQTARKAVDDDLIGRPIAFTAIMAGGGHETWHPSPEFYYQPGGGPMFDMGPYYLTALCHILGPIRRVAGLANIAISDRTITSEPLNGKKIDVQTPDHYVGVAEFANGVTGTMVQSFAMPVTDFNGKQPITLHGTEGMLRIPDPNNFDGTVLLKKKGDDDFTELEPATATGYGRSVGLADLCHAIRTGGRTPRCDIGVGFHVLDAMQGFRDSGQLGGFVEMTTDFARPDAMPAGDTLGTFA